MRAFVIIFFFRTETRTWRKVEPAGAPPVSRFGYVAVVHSHYFCLFGGYDGTTWLNDMHRFNFGELLSLLLLLVEYFEVSLHTIWRLRFS